MRRRQFLQGTGAILTATATTASLAAAGDADPRKGRKEGQPPKGNVSSTRVSPYPWDDGQTVPTGEWIRHQFGWSAADSCEKGGQETLEEILDLTRHRVKIAGEKIDDVDRYWQTAYTRESNDQCMTWWQYYTPPKEPGTYEFELTFHFEEEYEFSFGTVSPGQELHFSSMYEVVRGGNGNGDGKPGLGGR